MVGYGFNSTALTITFFFSNRCQPLNRKIELEDKRWYTCIQLVGDINQIFSIMAHWHPEYSGKIKFKNQLLWTLCWVYCSYNVMLFKESDCVFRYHVLIALGLGFSVTMNDKDSVLFNIQFTHCAHLCERHLCGLHVSRGRDQEIVFWPIIQKRYI